MSRGYLKYVGNSWFEIQMEQNVGWDNFTVLRIQANDKIKQ